MNELFAANVSPWTLLLVVVVFGFAPGCVLRIAVLLYPRDDPRRREFIADLKAMRRLDRPFWVAEQIETALFEGLGERRKARSSRKKKSRRHIEESDPSQSQSALVELDSLPSPRKVVTYEQIEAMRWIKPIDVSLLSALVELDSLPSPRKVGTYEQIEALRWLKQNFPPRDDVGPWEGNSGSVD